MPTPMVGEDDGPTRDDNVMVEEDRLRLGWISCSAEQRSLGYLAGQVPWWKSSHRRSPRPEERRLPKVLDFLLGEKFYQVSRFLYLFKDLTIVRDSNFQLAEGVVVMGNQNGTPGNDYYSRFPREHPASRYADGIEEDRYSDLTKSDRPWPDADSFRPTAAGVLRQGLDPTSISVLGRKTADLREHYIIGRKLGQGQFGTTYLCTEISTGCDFACKTILKRKLITKVDVEDVRREIQIMHHLSGHKNVVSIKDVYEDVQAVHIVMELLPGGELFDRIQGNGRYSEMKAAEITRIVVSIVAMCHSLGVMHRDLKPENFLLLDEDDDLSIKAIDFGLSVYFKPGQVFSELVGSPFYVAPEVLHKRYGPESDVWSAGVILYVLLCGVPPFWADTQKGIFDAVLKGHLDLESDPWPKISDGAKDLIRKMLCNCPSERLKAHEVLRHPWICQNGVATDGVLDPSVISRLKRFSAMNNLQKLALRVIAERLSEEEIAGLRELFKTVDIKNRGVITFGELRKGLTRYGTELVDTEICDIMEAADTDTDVTINYEEFIAATMPLNKIEREEHLKAAFTYFDKDGSGYITVDKLQQACAEYNMEGTLLEEIILEADQNNDGQIDYAEFVAMMQGNTNGGNIALGRPTMETSLNVTLRDAPQVH